MQKSIEIVPVRLDLNPPKKRIWESLIEGLTYLAVAWGTLGVFSLFTSHGLNRWIYERATGTWPPPSPQDFRDVFVWNMLPIMLIALILGFVASHFLSPYTFRLRRWAHGGKAKFITRANARLQNARLPILAAYWGEWEGWGPTKYYDLCKDGPVPFEEAIKHLWFLQISNGDDDNVYVKYDRQNPSAAQLKKGDIQSSWEVTCPGAEYDTESGLWRFGQTDFIIHGPWPA